MYWWLAVWFCIVFVVSESLGYQPLYPILSLTGQDSVYAISFITHSVPTNPGIQWCPVDITGDCNIPKPWPFAFADEVIEFFYPHEDDIKKNSTDWISISLMTGLLPNTTYRYYLSGNMDFDSITGITTNTFVTLPPPTATVRIAVFGDAGSQAPIFQYNQNYVATLMTKIDEYDFIIHYGDLAYNLCNSVGANGNAYLQVLTPITAKKPYLVTIGNHEVKVTNRHDGTTLFGENKTSNLIYDSMPYYRNWFGGQKQLAIDSGGDTQWLTWYSRAVGAYAHVIVISTEALCSNELQNSVASTNFFVSQYNWLVSELTRIRNMTTNQWIVILGHRQLYEGNTIWFHSQAMRYGFKCFDASCLYVDFNTYCNDTTMTGCAYSLEQLYSLFYVDLVISGHEHTYNRMYPIAPFTNVIDGSLRGEYQLMNETDRYYNPLFPVYVISGAPGVQPDSVLNYDCVRSTLVTNSTTTSISATPPPMSTTTGGGHGKTKISINVDVDESGDDDVEIDINVHVHKNHRRSVPRASGTSPRIAGAPTSPTVIQTKVGVPLDASPSVWSILTVDQFQLQLTSYFTENGTVLDDFYIIKSNSSNPIDIVEFDLEYTSHTSDFGPGCSQ